MNDQDSSRRRRPGGIVRILLWAYPRSFRARFGDDMLAVLAERRREAPGGWSRCRFWLGVALSMLRGGVLERLAPARRQAVAVETPRRPTSFFSVGQDLRYALRTLSRRPAFLVVVVLTLAVGVGANTAIFSVIDAVLLRPLPYPDPDSLVQVLRMRSERPGWAGSLSQPNLYDLSAQSKELAGLEGYRATTLPITGDGLPEVIDAAVVTGGLLSVFGMSPSLGRDLAREDNVYGGPKVVVLSYDLWQRRFAGARDVLGSTLELDGEPHQIVGVAPPGFAFPGNTKLWVPLFQDTEGCGRDCHLLRGIGRLADAQALARGREEFAVVAARLAQQYPESNRDTTYLLQRLQEGMVGDVRQGLLLMLGAVTLVLLIATANLANLMLACGTLRRAEIAVRAALGASRGRLLALLLAESGLLAASGAALGIGLAMLATRVLIALAPPDVPRLSEVTVDARVLGVGVVLALLSMLCFGGVPAWRVVRESVHGRRSTGDRTEKRSRALLLVGEVALSAVLLIGAGLLLRSFQRILAIDLGFDQQSVASFFLSLPERYDTPEKVVGLIDRLEQRLAVLPGVESVGSALGRPFGGSSISTTLQLTDEPEPRPGEETSTRIRVVTPGYFQTLRIPMIEGRSFSTGDRHGAESVAVVNQAFVETFSRSQPVLGRKALVGIDFGWRELPRTIVGVVGNTRNDSLTGEPEPELFVPQAQMGIVWMNVNLRTAADPDSLWGAIAATLSGIDPDLPVRSPETLEQAVRDERGPARFYLTLLGAFSMLALLLAALGLYGVVSYLVSRRTREIALRMVVGASRFRVLTLVVLQGLRPVVAGTVIGLVAAAGLTRLMSALLYGVAPLDAWTFATVPLALLAVSLAALWTPARRASRIAPAEALVEE